MVIYPVVMCGGAGTRPWPASTKTQPKQFHRLLTDQSVFQDTVLRLQNVGSVQVSPQPLIVSNEAYRDVILDQLEAIGVEPLALLLEPEPRNTAAVVAVSAEYTRRHDPDGLALMLPSDHHVAEPGVFHDALAKAAPIAAAGRITTFGIAPSRPDTGFGYIQPGDQIGPGVSEVKAFREKPDLETARDYLTDESFSWNDGILLFPHALMISELTEYAPEITDPALRSLDAGRQDGASIHLNAEHFLQVTSDSIDYAVMERTRHAAVCGPVSCGWSDIGTWPVIGDLQSRPPQIAPVLIDTEGCVVHADDGTLITAVGVKDLVIVSVGNSVPVVPKSQAQNVGKIVAELKRRDLRTVFDGPSFQAEPE